jgi:ABC-2 type transport system ATP-binding protein
VPGVVVENLVVKYNDLVAVDDVSFEAPEGRVTAVIGPNGAGKTSTIEVCEGFRTATSGRVCVLGLDPKRQHDELTTVMGVMLQGGGVYPSARVVDVVTLFCALHDRGAGPRELIDLVGLSTRAKSTWRQLSGGEQQRLSLALALAARPRVAFLDEPTSGVDIDGRDTIRTIIRDLAANGTTVRTEAIAGLTTFLAMAYIVFVNQFYLGEIAGMDAGAVFVATCLAAAIGTIVAFLVSTLISGSQRSTRTA